jgi:hypothetical protein
MLRSQATEPHTSHLQHPLNVDNPNRCNGTNGSRLLMRFTKVIFTHEATFKTSGRVNLHNCVY